MPGLLTTKTPPSPSPSLYHILLTTTHITHDPTAEMQKVRVCGTYVSLSRATAEAHRVLFEAGYEREWFTTFDAAHAHAPTHPAKEAKAKAQAQAPPWPHGADVVVFAVAPAGDTFTVSVAVAPNTHGWTAADDVDDSSSGRVAISPLFHVLRTTTKVFDGADETAVVAVEESCESYKEAWAVAGKVLGRVRDDGGKGWAEYDALPLGERDGDFGEDVVVHAVGFGGENVRVSVVEAVESNTVRMEAAMRIR